MHFDLEGSLQRMGGDLDLFCLLTEYFFADAPSLVERIAQAIEQRDGEKLERAAHSVKGLAANFGAAQVVAAAGRLEDLGRQDAAGDGAEALIDLENALSVLYDELGPYRR